jgi:hypothetical protein
LFCCLCFFAWVYFAFLLINLLYYSVMAGVELQTFSSWRLLIAEWPTKFIINIIVENNNNNIE